MVVVTQRLGHPIPVARVVQTAVHQNQGRLAVRAPIPELELQAVGIKEVRDGFQDSFMLHAVRSIRRLNVESSQPVRFD